MNKLTFLLCLPLLLGLLTLRSQAQAPATPQKPENVKHVNAKQAAELLEKHKDVVVLDIRTAKEFQEGHIAHAKNIDFYEKDFADQVEKLDKSKTYLVHCASGGRSTRSLPVFEKLNFKSIYHLDGGFKGWQRAGQAVEK